MVIWLKVDATLISLAGLENGVRGDSRSGGPSSTAGICGSGVNGGITASTVFYGLAQGGSQGPRDETFAAKKGYTDFQGKTG
jgi:hypothetical protein